MKKLVTMLLALLTLTACLAGCGAAEKTDLQYIQEKGTLIVGITDYAPMDYKDENGDWTGFDAEFARLFGERLGVSVEFFLLADWNQKFYELETKNIDAIWNGMTISEEVLRNTNCSNPYVVNAQVVVMKEDAAGSYPDAASLTGLKFAVESGSVGEAALQDLGITDYIALQDQASALMEVAAGTAEACVIDITMANAMTGPGTGYPALVKSIRLTEEEYGVGFRKDSDLTEKFNQIMEELMADGTLDALAEKYNLTLVK